MQLSFQIQLLSLAQDAEVLNLLCFTSAPLVPLNSKIKAKYWSRGSNVYQRPKDIDKLIALISEKQVNMVALQKLSKRNILVATYKSNFAK